MNTEKLGRWIINGNGTATDTEHGVMWIQAPWGMEWNGSTFTGHPIEINWHDAAEMFGSGTIVRGHEQYAHLSEPDFHNAKYENGYTPGNCTVDFAGCKDWRLPTAAEFNTLYAHQINNFLPGEEDKRRHSETDRDRSIVEYYRLLEVFKHCAGSYFWSATMKWNKGGYQKLFNMKGRICAWKYSLDQYIDDWADFRYQVLFVRETTVSPIEDNSDAWITGAMTSARSAACARLELDVPFSKAQLDVACRQAKNVPGSNSKQIQKDYDILLPLSLV